MTRIIAVFDSSTGEIHGFRDFPQALAHLEEQCDDADNKKALERCLDNDGGYHNGNYISELTLHKSKRGGAR